MTTHQEGQLLNKVLHGVVKELDKELGQMKVVTMEAFTKDEFYLCQLIVIEEDDYENCGGYRP